MFARRALQKRLSELRAVLADGAVGRLAARANRPGKDRLAAMWEIVILHGLSRHGKLRNEKPLASGRRPDIDFENGAVRFTADVTSVSDEGLDENNPYRELADLIEAAKTKLGRPIGGVDLRVKSEKRASGRGTRVVLRLPPRTKLQTFVQQKIVPELRAQIDAGKRIYRIAIDDEEAGLDITIDPAKSPYSSGGFAAYDVPTIKDRNPLYMALKPKAAQMRGADALSGVIVGDGGCAALAERSPRAGQVSALGIAEEFLRQYSSVDFVLLLTVHETSRGGLQTGHRERRLHPVLAVQPGHPAAPILAQLFTDMLAELPNPAMMPVNAALRAREPGYELGYHGGSMVNKDKVRIGSREFVEILAGLRTIEDGGAKNVAAARSQPRQMGRVQAALLHHLKRGELPSSISVVKTGEDDNDDWIEIEFGPPDPAISPLK